MQMEIHITNLAESAAMVDRIALGFATNMEPALVKIGELGSKYFGGVAYQSKGSQFGMPWADLAVSTRAEKDKSWKGAPDMVRTGAMMNGFTYEVKGSASVRLYNSVPYFKYHQSNGEHHKLPRRVMIGVNDSLRAMAVGVIKKQVAIIIEEARA